MSDDVARQAQSMMTEARAGNEGAAGAAVQHPSVAAAEKKPEEQGLPEGWSVAYDAQKRPYYWHKETKKVQWDKPTAETAVA
jgi:hypothetical protein